MLEHVTLPDSISYFLQGRQWIDASSGSDAEWLRKLETSAAQIATQPVTIPPPSTALRRIDLPAPPGDLIGTNREVEDIVDRYRDGARLITLTGPGGIGKTRVALEAARGVAEVVATDVLFIDLAPVDESDLVPSAIARSLGVRESGDRSTGESIRVATRYRQLLMLLDNFEQVIDAAPLVGELLADASQLRILVTSREALRLRGEQEIVIDALELPTEQDIADLDRLSRAASVELFIRTARASKSGFNLTAENASAVAEICRRLDGLPLAIELAATRIKHVPPASLLDQLQLRLPMLTGGPRDLPAR